MFFPDFVFFFEERDSLRLLVTNRSGGVSKKPYDSLNLSFNVQDNVDDVMMNRSIVSDFVGNDIQYILSEHGTHIRNVDDEITPVSDADHTSVKQTRCVSLDAEKSDGLLTTRPVKPLAALSADCMSIALWAKSMFCILHVGWKGFHKGIIEHALDIVRAENNVRILCGPAICHECFTVPKDRYEMVASMHPAAAVLDQNSEDPYRLSLRDGVNEIFSRTSHSVEHIDVCTACDESFFSFRRSGSTGRFAMVGWLEHE